MKIYRFLYYFLYITILSWGMRVFFPCKFVNQKRKFEKGTIMLSNHLSNIDSVVNITHFPVRSIIFAKKELGKSPLKILGKIFNIVFVDRGQPDINAVKIALGGLKKGERLLLYPEGTRNKADDGELLEIKNGAALFSIRCKAPMTILLMHHRSKIFHKNYIYMGETFELSEFYGAKPNKEILNSASEIITKRMTDAREKFEQIMRERYGHKKWYKKYVARIQAQQGA